MIRPEFLKLLRCPVAPDRDSALEATEDALVCVRCRVRFPIKDGLPNLLVEAAELPAGCTHLKQLPCQVQL
jgi:uncharacterized protein